MDTVGCMQLADASISVFLSGLLSGPRVRRNSLGMIVRSYVYWRYSRTMSSMERIKVASYFEPFSNFVFFFLFARGKMNWNLSYRFDRRKLL